MILAQFFYEFEFERYEDNRNEMNLIFEKVCVN